MGGGDEAEMLLDRDANKCFDKDTTVNRVPGQVPKQPDKPIKKYKDKFINKHENKQCIDIDSTSTKP